LANGAFLARGDDRPSGPEPDREAAIATGDAIPGEEVALARAKDKEAERGYHIILEEKFPVDIRHHRLHEALCQMLLHAYH
jgi:hypothetical protein